MDTNDAPPSPDSLTMLALLHELSESARNDGVQGSPISERTRELIGKALGVWYGESSYRALKAFVKTCEPGGIGPAGASPVISARLGIDWDNGRILIETQHPLTKLTVEQVQDLQKSARAGQSWHAYQQYRLCAQKLASLQARIDELTHELAEARTGHTSFLGARSAVAFTLPVSIANDGYEGPNLVVFTLCTDDVQSMMSAHDFLQKQSDIESIRLAAPVAKWHVADEDDFHQQIDPKYNAPLPESDQAQVERVSMELKQPGAMRLVGFLKDTTCEVFSDEISMNRVREAFGLSNNDDVVSASGGPGTSTAPSALLVDANRLLEDS